MSDVVNRVEVAVEKWFDVHLRTGAVARTTEVYNQLLNSKSALLEKLKAEIEADAGRVEAGAESLISDIDGGESKPAD